MTLWSLAAAAAGVHLGGALGVSVGAFGVCTFCVTGDPVVVGDVTF